MRIITLLGAVALMTATATAQPYEYNHHAPPVYTHRYTPVHTYRHVHRYTPVRTINFTTRAPYHCYARPMGAWGHWHPTPWRWGNSYCYNW